MGFLDSLKNLLTDKYDDENDFDLVFTSEPFSHDLEPIELVNRAVKAMTDNAKEWPDGIDLPDSLEVWISPHDYDYYGLRRTLCEQRIAQAMVQHAERAHALLEHEPTVVLRVDPTLCKGDMRATSRFTGGAEVISGPPPREAKGGLRTRVMNANPAPPTETLDRTANQPDTAANPAAPAPGNASANVPAGAPIDTPTSTSAIDPHATPAFSPEPAATNVTPEFKPDWVFAKAAAKLTRPACEIDVLDGDVIGCTRHTGDPLPDISLDEEDHPFVSQKHARFAQAGDTWTITSFGRNGTSVQRHGIWTDLNENLPFELQEGDRISFAHSAPHTFTLNA